MNRSLLLLFLMLSSSAPLSAQTLRPRADVERGSEQIFRSPEFRHLRDLPASRRGSSGQRISREGDGNGGNGDGENGNGNGDGNARDGDEQQNRRERDRDAQNANDPPEDDSIRMPSSSFGSFGSGAAALMQGLGWIALAAMIGVVVYLLVKTIMDREEKLESDLDVGGDFSLGEIETDVPPGAIAVNQYLARGDELARQGLFREAVGQVVLASMSEIEHRQLIRYRKGLTLRDYFRSIRKQRELASAYREILKIYEPLGFGRRVPEALHYQKSRAAFEEGFRRETPLPQN